MRARLFYVIPKPQYREDWDEFLRQVAELDTHHSSAERLGDGLWLLPIPENQEFHDDLKVLASHFSLSMTARTREVDCVSDWETLS